MNLTVSERILLHLYRWRPGEGEPDEQQTQLGVARVTGTSGDHAAAQLYDLMRMGWVEKRGTAKNSRTERQTIAYSLTPGGEIAAEEIIREIVSLYRKILPLIETEGVR